MGLLTGSREPRIPPALEGTPYILGCPEGMAAFHSGDKAWRSRLVLWFFPKYANLHFHSPIQWLQAPGDDPHTGAILPGC